MSDTIVFSKGLHPGFFAWRRKIGTFYISGVGARRAEAITFLVEGNKVVERKQSCQTPLFHTQSFTLHRGGSHAAIQPRVESDRPRHLARFRGTIIGKKKIPGTIERNMRMAFNKKCLR